MGVEEGKIDKLAITNGEKILLLLSEFRRFEKDYRLPEELSQDGIARIVGMRRGNVAKELIKLRDRGFVTDKLVHFEGSRRRKKGYFLTDSGFNLSARIKDYVKNHRIIFKHKDGSSSEVVLADAVKQLGRGTLYAEVVSGLQDGRLYNAVAVAMESDLARQVDRKQVSRFVGRADELNIAKELVLNALEGNGSCLLVSGEAGVGKTRLVHEVVNLFKDRGVRFLKANCLYQTAVDPYLPLVDTLGDYLSKAKGGVKDAALAQVRAGAPEFVGLLPVGTEIHGIAPPAMEKAINLEGERKRIFETFAAVLRIIAGNVPLVLFVDDLHWADAGTVRLLHYLARSTRRAPILIIGAYRPEELVSENGESHPLSGEIEKMRKERLVIEVELKRLGADDVSLLVGSRLNLEKVPEELSAILYEESEGNPFFLEELVDSLKEGVGPAGLDREWTLPSEIKVPEGIKGLIGSRINRLSEGQRKLLEMASVIGEKFDSDLILQAIQEDEGALLDALEKLIETRLIYEDASEIGSYRFHHGKIQEVLYKDMNSAKRRLLHGRVAGMLESLYEDDVEKGAGELAYHFSRTREYGKTYRYSMMAGERAARVYSFDEAVSHYGTALEALVMVGDDAGHIAMEADTDMGLPDLKADVLFRQGKAYDVLGRWEDSIDSHKKALGQAASGRKKIEIISNISDMYRKKGLLDEAMEACREGLGLLGEDCRESSLLLNAVGNVINSEGRFGDSLEYYERALEMAERINDRVVSGMILVNIAVGYSRMGEAEKSIAYQRKSLSVWEEMGDLERIAITCQNLGVSLTRIGRYAEALELFGKALEIASRIGERERISDIHMLMGLIYSHMDDHEKGADLILKSLEEKERIGDFPKMVYAWMSLGSCYIGMGSLDKAEEALGKSLEIGSKTGGTKEAVAQSFCELARCSLKRNDTAKALEYCNLAQGIADELKTKVSIGIARKAFGIVYGETGDYDRSRKSFEESLKVWKDVNNMPQLEETYYEFAQMWKKKGDLDKARKCLEWSLNIVNEGGLEKKAGRMKKELAELEN